MFANDCTRLGDIVCQTIRESVFILGLKSQFGDGFQKRIARRATCEEYSMNQTSFISSFLALYSYTLLDFPNFSLNNTSLKSFGDPQDLGVKDLTPRTHSMIPRCFDVDPNYEFCLGHVLSFLKIPLSQKFDDETKPIQCFCRRCLDIKRSHSDMMIW